MFPDAPDDVLDLLYKMLVYNPEKRITAEEVGTTGFGILSLGIATSLLHQRSQANPFQRYPILMVIRTIIKWFVSTNNGKLP